MNLSFRTKQGEEFNPCFASLFVDVERGTIGVAFGGLSGVFDAFALHNQNVLAGDVVAVHPASATDMTVIHGDNLGRVAIVNDVLMTFIGHARGSNLNEGSVRGNGSDFCDLDCHAIMLLVGSELAGTNRQALCRE